MNLIYECRLCGQTFTLAVERALHLSPRDALANIVKNASTLPGEPRPLAVHDCEPGRTGLAELVGTEK